jgi:Chlorite dismutase
MSDAIKAPPTELPLNPPRAPGLAEIDVHEYGGKRDGVKQKLDRRTFMQLRVFNTPIGESPDAYAEALTARLVELNQPFVLYEDAASIRSLGLLVWDEDPARFTGNVRKAANQGILTKLDERLDFSMLGRTYSTGHEPDLEHVLLRRPIGNVLAPEYGWHVWYPLRRNGAFAVMDSHEQSIIMREHASIGMAYGQADYAHDIRLACHGMDARDNEFVIGLVSDNLHRLSHLVQTMRKTRQTSEFIVQMGPFFVGRAVKRHG